MITHRATALASQTAHNHSHGTSSRFASNGNGNGNDNGYGNGDDADDSPMSEDGDDVPLVCTIPFSDFGSSSHFQTSVSDNSGEVRTLDARRALPQA